MHQWSRVLLAFLALTFIAPAQATEWGFEDMIPGHTFIDLDNGDVVIHGENRYTGDGVTDGCRFLLEPADDVEFGLPANGHFTFDDVHMVVHGQSMEFLADCGGVQLVRPNDEDPATGQYAGVYMPSLTTFAIYRKVGGSHKLLVFNGAPAGPGVEVKLYGFGIKEGRVIDHTVDEDCRLGWLTFKVDKHGAIHWHFT